MQGFFLKSAFAGLLIASASPLHAAVLGPDAWAGGSGIDPTSISTSTAGTALTGSADFVAVDLVDIGGSFENEGGECGDSSVFPTGCTQYSATLAFTNATNMHWNDFHMRLGYGGEWTSQSQDYPQPGEEPFFELSNGIDQPVDLSGVSSDLFGSTSVVAGAGEAGVVPDLGIYDVGINWFDGTVDLGETVELSFLMTLGDVTGDTDWNTDFYGYPPGSTDGYVLTARLYPTVSSVPAPGVLALLAIGLMAMQRARAAGSK